MNFNIQSCHYLAVWFLALACSTTANFAATPSSRDERKELVVTARDRQHWSFRPIERVTPPVFRAGDRVARTPVDAFLFAALEAKQLQPGPEAPKRTLIRRLYFDLVGLPPKPEEIDAFVNDPSPLAYEELVDRLLADPHFGERWSRHWLDVARYADSKGYERDGDRPNVWRYRDFVIRAFNEDLPFDTFIQWQLAGDEYAPADLQARVATAFIGLGPIVETDTKLADELARYRFADLDDMLSTTGSAMLGLSIGCARCHDHKYDPIPTRDYYRMLAAFTSTERRDWPLAPPAEVGAHKRATADHARRLTAAKTALEDWLWHAREPVKTNLLAQKSASLKPGAEEPKLTDDDYRKAFSAAQRAEWDRLDAAVKQLEAEAPRPLPAAMIVTDKNAVPAKNYLMKRGEPTHPGEALQLGFLTVLSGARPPRDYFPARMPPGVTNLVTTGQRTALAEWMTDTENGAGNLLARVIVNRVWQHHFGEGLVRTPNDFGTQGDPPTHPELLEWLAGELIRGGWGLKPLHRLIVTSTCYRQAGADPAFEPRNVDASATATHQEQRVPQPVDPDNRLLQHRRPVRLESEILRDSILEVSGVLNPKMFGPGVKAAIPPELNSAYNTLDPYPQDVTDTPDTWRRSVYLFTKRSLRQPLLETFDGADPSASCARRLPTTVAPQALALLNDPFVRARAKDFARRVITEAGEDRSKQVVRSFLLALGRAPTAAERDAALRFISGRASVRASRHESGSARLALADFCHTLFGLNEFLYVD